MSAISPPGIVTHPTRTRSEVLAHRVEPVALLRELADRPRPVLARHRGVTVVAADPDLVVEGEGVWSALAAPDPDADPECAMAGGWIGFLGDALANSVERLPPARPDPGGPPKGVVGRYPTVALIDADGRCAIQSRDGTPALRSLARAAERARACAAPTPGARSVFTSLPDDAYRTAVEEVRELIAAGDCYQVNLTQRLSAPWSLGPQAFAEALWRAAGPSTHRAFVGTPDGAVVSASPERLLAAHAGRAVSEPIKGTAPAGLGELLARSGKDRAEHVMIVDLVRNDLGRVSVPGGVRVESLMAPLSMPYASHMVSAISGRLRPGVNATETLRALFPAGSVTGCPKVRAIEIIRQLEPVARGPAYGSVIALGTDDSIESSVAIRTAWVSADEARYWSGGAVVWDSDPEAERREAWAKAAPFLAAVGA